VTELESMTLMSDGASIYECASPDEIIDLLAEAKESSVSLLESLARG